MGRPIKIRRTISEPEPVRRRDRWIINQRPRFYEARTIPNPRIQIQWLGFYKTQTNHIHPIQDLRHPLYPSSLMPIRIWTAHADRTVPTHRLPPEQSDTAVNGSSGDTGLAGPPHGDPAPQISINRTLCEKEVKANPIIVHLLAIETQLVLLTMARGSEAPPLPR